MHRSRVSGVLAIESQSSRPGDQYRYPVIASMPFSTDKIAGSEAIATLEARRASYPETGAYPFLIGDTEELERIKEAAEFNDQSFDDIIRGALDVDLVSWIAERRSEAEEYEFSPDDALGTWPGEVAEKGAVSLHRDVLSRRIKPHVFLGSTSIEEPWHLPAVLKYGAWNDCPEPEIHCAFHRKWQSGFGAQIAGVSGDVVECIVNNPPLDQGTAIELAWQQYWYCADIVEQGCESVSNLAANLLNSPYWYFWWD